MTDTAGSDPLRLGFFSRSVVSRVARDRGIFARYGLSVSEHPVPSSPAQFRSLDAGEYDLVLTSPDNVAAYRLTEANPIGARLDVRMLLGFDAGLGLSIVSRPEVADLADLRGRTIAVDVPASGFALALFSVLARHGLRRDRDFTLVSLGSTPQRRKALLAGECDATLLNAGHDIAAEMAGCRRLARITDTLSPYLGTVLATTGRWLDANLDLARRFGDAWLAATAIVLDPAERGYVEPLVGEELALPQGGAAAGYAMLASARDGLNATGEVDDAALRTVLGIRAEYGGPDTGIDLSPGAIESSGLVDRRLMDR
jgi:ABC-type nitrate/sulfonate/bicarbonate transport system substrate-binding protein